MGMYTAGDEEARWRFPRAVRNLLFARALPRTPPDVIWVTFPTPTRTQAIRYEARPRSPRRQQRWRAA